MKIRKAYILLLFLVFVLTITGCNNNKNTRGKVQILDLEANGKHLLFYGSKHSNDSSNPMFKDIEEYFHSMKPQIVFVEGDFNNYKFDDKESAIRKGESVFVVYLANDNNNVLLESIEPSMEEQFDYLLKKYDRESIIAMYVLRQIYQYQNQNKNNPILFIESMEQYVSHLTRDGLQLSEEADFKSIQRLLKPYLQIEIDEDNWTTIDVYSVVYISGNKINDIYREIYTLRNEKLKSNIGNALHNYDRIFVIMGSDHVLDEKDNIKHIFYDIAK